MKINLEFKPSFDGPMSFDKVPSLRDIIETVMGSYAKEYIEQLQWYHTPFKDKWAGQRWRCKETGEEFTIPDNVRERDFFTFGNSYIDVGRNNCYCRFGGSPEQIKE